MKIIIKMIILSTIVIRLNLQNNEKKIKNHFFLFLTYIIIIYNYLFKTTLLFFIY